MPQRLTDRTEKSTEFSLSDLLHLVDVSNTSQDPAGSSFKSQIGNVLKAFVPIRILGCMVLRPGGGGSNSQIIQDDWVFYMNNGSQNRLTIGIATGTITNVPTDLDNTSLFDKFYEGSKLLP